MDRGGTTVANRKKKPGLLEAEVSMRIGEMLVARGLVTEHDVAAALERQRSTGRRLGETLFEMGAISSFDLAAVLADRQGVEFVDLDSVDVSLEAMACIPLPLARQYGALGVEVNEQRLRVAMVNPSDLYAVDDLRAVTGLEIHPVMADPAQILSRIADETDALDADAPGEAGSDEEEATSDHGTPGMSSDHDTEHSIAMDVADAALVAAELRRLEFSRSAIDGSAANVWSEDAMAMWHDLYFLAFRNLAHFLSSTELPNGAAAFVEDWPPTDRVTKDAVARLCAQSDWLDRRLAGPATANPDRTPMPQGRIDEMHSDLTRVLDAFRSALPADRRAWFGLDSGDATTAATAPPHPAPTQLRHKAIGLQAFAELRAT